MVDEERGEGVDDAEGRDEAHAEYADADEDVLLSRGADHRVERGRARR